MTNYQCLICDTENAVREVFDVQADNDGAALKKARMQVGPFPSAPLVEVWREGRVIGRLTRIERV